MRRLTVEGLITTTGAGANTGDPNVGHMKNYGHITYGGQGGGFVGTNSCGMDLGNLIKNNSCVAGIVAGALSGATSVPGAIRGAVIGSIGGMCYSDSKGGGNSSNNSNGGNYGAQCSW